MVWTTRGLHDHSAIVQRLRLLDKLLKNSCALFEVLVVSHLLLILLGWKCILLLICVYTSELFFAVPEKNVNLKLVLIGLTLVNTGGKEYSENPNEGCKTVFLHKCCAGSKEIISPHNFHFLIVILSLSRETLKGLRGCRLLQLRGEHVEKFKCLFQVMSVFPKTHTKCWHAE